MLKDGRGSLPRFIRLEKEMIVRFIGMLQAPYNKKVVRSFLKNFMDVVILYGRIDEAMKNESSKKICKNKEKKKMKVSK